MGTVKFSIQEVNQKRILARTFAGSIIVQEVIDSFEHILTNYFTKEHKFEGLITDLSDAKLDFKLSEFRSMINYLKRNKLLTSVPYAVIENSPINNLFPSLVSKFIGMQLKTFKTVEDAMNWFEKQTSSKAS